MLTLLGKGLAVVVLLLFAALLPPLPLLLLLPPSSTMPPMLCVKVNTACTGPLAAARCA